MGTENLPITAADAPKPEVQPAVPAGPPAGYISGLDISDEMIDNASLREKDKLIVARATAREAQRIAAEKVKAESDASSKRAKDAVDALVKKDKETPEDEKPTSDPAKGYDLQIPEVGADKQQVLNDTVADVSQLGADVGIDPGELQQLVNVATDFALDEPEGLSYENIDECVNVLRGIWGSEYDKRVAVVNEQVKQWGPEVEHYLNATGIGNSPGVVRAIYEHATKGKMTGVEAIKQIAKIQGDLNHPYWKGDRKAIAEMRMLQEVSNKHAAKPAGGRTVEGTATTSEIEQAIAAIRANPDYTSLDSRKRKPLVEQMAALQAQIHG
jgi:hypothetical protein